MADVLATQQYYPFGMLMPGDTALAKRRQYSLNGYDYRYGFNGKEGDDEVKGDDNQQDYGMRIYDPRVARFLSVDPLAGKNNSYSPYHAFANNPVIFVDPDGQDNFLYIVFVNKGGTALTKSQKESITKYTQSLLTNHGLNVEVKYLDFSANVPISPSLLDPTDRLVYVGSKNAINDLAIPDGEGGALFFPNGPTTYGTSGKQVAAVNFDEYNLKKLPKDYLRTGFINFYGINIAIPKEVDKRNSELNDLMSKYGGVIDYVAHTSRTILHEWAHTYLGGSHADEGAAERYRDGKGGGPGILTSGSYPKVPFPKEMLPQSLKFHEIDKTKLWEILNTKGWDREKSQWIPASKPVDNFGRKYAKNPRP